MKYQNIVIESLAAYIPENKISSLEIEQLLAPAYGRLNLSPGRLELFSGIKERRYWPLATTPSQVSAAAGRKAMQQAGVEPDEIDLLIHCSVCRDFLEPATASVVHNLLGLKPTAGNFDVSNACLGMITATMLVADLISAGRIRRGMVVSGEIGFPLLNRTIQTLNDDIGLTRKSIKPHFASLTIGSCASAMIISHDSVKKTDGHRLLAGTEYSATMFNHLCQGSADSGINGESGPLMHTDSEELLVKGVEAASMCWPEFLKESGLKESQIDKIITHQVGTAHRNLLFKTLNLGNDKDFSSFEILGNCGSSSLPATAALASDAKHLKKGDTTAFLGIGSGINCAMLAIEW